MTSLEERMARVEACQENLERRLGIIEEKLDRVLALANFGKGSLWMLVKVGAIGTLLVGAMAWVVLHVRFQ